MRLRNVNIEDNVLKMKSILRKEDQFLMLSLCIHDQKKTNS